MKESPRDIAHMQVQDINLLHTLVAGCLGYRYFIEQRDVQVSSMTVHAAIPALLFCGAMPCVAHTSC